jgi:hypothetical protein
MASPLENPGRAQGGARHRDNKDGGGETAFHGS